MPLSFLKVLKRKKRVKTQMKLWTRPRPKLLQDHQSLKVLIPELAMEPRVKRRKMLIPKK